MKLYNNTSVPDEILAPVLKEAAKAIKGTRHGKVVVKVIRSREHCTGAVFGTSSVSRNFLNPRKYPNERSGYVATDDAVVILRLPKAGDPILWPAHTWREPLYIAERFFDYALHEWGHVKDFQGEESFCHYRRRWANRPHERRAEGYMLEAKERGFSESAQMAIIDLAVYLESEVKSKP